jgi:hypothetical protein
MDDKLFDHLRASTDAKYIKSLKELFMDFYGKCLSFVFLAVPLSIAALCDHLRGHDRGDYFLSTNFS